MKNQLSPPRLPPAAATLLHSIDSGAVLGASRQLHVLGEVLTEVATSPAEPSDGGLVQTVRALVDHVARTRGASSQGVLNGLERMARPVLDDGLAPASRPGELVESVRAFRAELDECLAAVRRHGQGLLKAHQSILAYDYSSTVAQVLGDVCKRNGGLTVFVPEARSLDGGRKYLADWRDQMLDIRLVPDAAVGWAVARCGAAVVGAETLSAEGGCYNTIGTSVVAHEARRHAVPFYVLSVLLKTDFRTPGGERPSPSLDFLDRLDGQIPDAAAMTVDGGFPDLDYTAPADISGVVTEKGVVDPGQVRELATAALDLSETTRG